MKKEEGEIKEGIKEEISKLDILIDKSSKVDLLYERAKLLMQLGENTKAVNDFSKILKLDPEQKYAKAQLEYLTTIIRYNNTDIYASTNTNFDPWLE